MLLLVDRARPCMFDYEHEHGNPGKFPDCARIGPTRIRLGATGITTQGKGAFGIPTSPRPWCSLSGAVPDQAKGRVITGGHSWTPAIGQRDEPARRNPILLFAFAGLFPLRFADRQFVALLFQLPPRLTRLEPLRPLSPLGGQC